MVVGARVSSGFIGASFARVGTLAAGIPAGVCKYAFFGRLWASASVKCSADFSPSSGVSELL